MHSKALKGLGLISLLGIGACGQVPTLQSCASSIPKEVANVSRRGALLESERWSGKIRLMGDVFVGPGCRLEVEAGTEIMIADEDSLEFSHAALFDTDPLKALGWSALPHATGEADSQKRIALGVLEGHLQLLGEATRPIRFVAEGDAGWSGLIALRPRSLRVEGVEITRAYRGLEIIGPYDNHTLEVSDSRFEDIESCGLCLDGETDDRAVVAEVRGNTFRAGRGAGIEAHAFVSALIERNVFETIQGTDGGGAAIRLFGNAASILDNEFRSNDLGIDCAAPSAPGASGNRFSDGALRTNCLGLDGPL